MSWQSLIMYHYLRKIRSNQKYRGKRISVPATHWKKQFGRDYAKHLQLLEKNKWIRIYHCYSNLKENRFTKAYLLATRFWEEEFVDYAVPVTPRTLNKFGCNQDSSDTSSPYLSLIKQRHDTIYMTEAPDTSAEKLKVFLDLKIASISRKSEGRVFHRVIFTDSDYRKFMTYGDRGKLVNVDVHAMVQQIFNIQVQDRVWREWIENDFHSTFMKEMGMRSRDRAKELFMAGISKKDNKASIAVRGLLAKEFPKILAYVDQLNVRGTVQGRTQKMESKIIERFIMGHKHLNMIPAHDGVFCGHLDAWEVQDALKAFLVSEKMVPKSKIEPYSQETAAAIEKLKGRTIVDILNAL